MRNLKKFLALVLAMLMVVSAGATVSAYSDVADEDAYAAAIAALTEWGIVNGTELGEAEDGSDALYEPDADVTRWQMALMMARTLAPEVEEEDWAEGMEIFGDVTEWYGAIAYAYVEGIVNGVSTEELVFKPNDGIKYQDGLIMALRALGYEVDCSGVVYWLDAWTQAKQIGLTDGIAITSGAKTMTRAEMAQLIYNMINLPFADGSESLAIKYYGEEAPIGDATTFVITATPKQAYVKGQHTDATKAEGETAATLVGLQELEAGIPAGDIIYFEAEALGIDAAKADAYLHYAVNLYDYDAEYSTFSAVEIVADPVAVRGTAITESGSTIKVNGYTYYLVDSLTDAARRNEIVVFTGDADKKDSLVLIKNKDGDILNFDGKIVATYVYTLGSTNYYVDKDVDGNPVVISEAKALAEYGVKTADDAVFTEYETLDAVADSTPYQLSLFDDNGDGKYDRAIYNKVYMSVYKEVKDNKEQTLGPWGANTDNAKNLAWSDASVKTKGTIFTYTYNPQLKLVTVLETLTKQSGVVTNVIYKDSKVVIDGTTYIVVPDEAKMGADVNNSGTDAAGARKWSEIAKGSLYYTTLDNFYAIGNTYEFYAYNGYILNANKINPVDEDANWKYFVSAGAVSYDSTAVYVDGYVANGEKTTIEIAVIDADAEIDNIEKDTAIENMNIFDLGEFLADAKTLFAKGNLFKVVPREDGTYRLLTNKFDGDVAPIKATVGGIDVYTYENFEFKAAARGEYEFDEGKTISSDKTKRLRTNDNTVFYFVEYDTVGGKISDLDIYRGIPKDEWSITVGGSVYMYADKIGYGTSTENAYNGIASTVVVYYTQADETANRVDGFNITSIDKDYDIVYVTKFKNDDISIVPASQVTEDTAVPFYYKSTGKNAIDMATGKVIDTVYVANAPITANGFYKLYDGKIIGDAIANTAACFENDVINSNYAVDFADEWLEFGDINATDKIDAVKLVSATEGKIEPTTKNDDVKAALVGATGKVVTVYYLADAYRVENSHSLVVVKLATNAPTPDPDTTVSGTLAGYKVYDGANVIATLGLKYTLANGIYTFEVYEDADADGKYEEAERVNMANHVAEAGRVKIYDFYRAPLYDTNWASQLVLEDYEQVIDIDAKGNVTLAFTRATIDGTEYGTLEAGKYLLNIELASANADSLKRVIEVKVEIAQ